MAAKKMARAGSDPHGPSQRQLRVGEEMRHAFARILMRGGLRDPALQDADLTVSEVRVSPDLKHATVFVMPLAGRRAAETMEGLRRGASFFRMAVAHEMTLRVVPTLVFELDASFDQASRIDALLRRPEVVRDLEPGPSTDGSDDGA